MFRFNQIKSTFELLLLLHHRKSVYVIQLKELHYQDTIIFGRMTEDNPMWKSNQTYVDKVKQLLNVLIFHSHDFLDQPLRKKVQILYGN